MSGLIAVYPGSFDPVTCGHLDIIERGAAVFAEVIVGVAVNDQKQPLFTIAERVEMLRESCAHFGNVRVDSFTTLLVNYARSQGASIIIKGLRAVSDFESELSMALMNKQLEPDIETLFMMTRNEYSFLSSRVVKEVASLGGDVSSLVPPPVLPRLMARTQAA